MKVIFADGTMEATEYPEGWVFLRWMDNQRGKVSVKLVKDLMFAENYILQKRLKGWFTSSETAHKMFQMLLVRVGAKFYLKDPEYVHFHKWIEKESDLYKPKRGMTHVRLSA